jgi:hypothetical protein
VILGQTTVGATDDSANANAKIAQTTTSPAFPVTVVAAYGLFRATASGSQPFRVVLYSDSAGAPNALLGVSSDLTVTFPGATAATYQAFSFATPVTLAGSTVFWYGYHAGAVTGTTPIMMDTTGSFKFQTAAADTFSDGAAATFGATSSFAANVCLYLVCADGRLLGLGVGA